jgi:hypothetical protein
VAVLCLLTLSGCGFQAAMAKTHAGIKAMSAEVEPPLAAHCLAKARACHAAKDAECEPLVACRKLKAGYVVSTKTLHRALKEMAGVHRQLVKEGVVTP